MNKFRSDINGLRAIAVLGVVLFHYKPDWLPGGFAGVDVFFVISGFLMTGIIIEKLLKNNFSFFDFYLKRALRIIPALSLLCISLIVIGFFVLDPASYQVLAKDAISTVLFISNYIYFFNSGYFDQSSQERFLLHSWSLSVEWQFYLLLPPLMVFLYKKIRNDLFVYLFSFLVVTLLLLELGLWLYKPGFIYYDFICRSWELLLGGLIYFIPKIRSSLLKNVAFYSGFFSIVFSFFYFDSSFAWPGYYALLPVAGAGLIIFSKKHSFLLDNVIFQKIGSTSYSLYLVHWPLIVLYKKLNIELTWLNYVFLCCALTFLLNFFGEKKRGSFKKNVVVYLSLSFAAVSIAHSGMPSRLKNPEAFNMSVEQYRIKYEGNLQISDSPNVVYFNGNEKDFDYILIGSSHARHYYSYIKNNNVKVASLALDGCNITKNYMTESYNDKLCEKRYDQMISFINSHPGKIVLWSTLWTWIGPRRDGASDQTPLLEKIYKEVNLFIKDIDVTKNPLYLIGDVQGSKKLMFECLAKNELPLNSIFHFNKCQSYQKENDDGVNAVLARIAGENKNTFFIAADKALCSNKKCVVMKDNQPLYTDYGHLSKEGSEIVGKYIFQHVHELDSMQR